MPRGMWNLHSMDQIYSPVQTGLWICILDMIIHNLKPIPLDKIFDYSLLSFIVVLHHMSFSTKLQDLGISVMSKFKCQKLNVFKC